MIHVFAATVSAALVVIGVGRWPAWQPTRRLDGPVASERSDAPVRRFGHGRIVVAAAAILLVALFEPLLAIVLGGAAAAWPPAVRIMAERSARQTVAASLPDAIELLILVVHAGMTPHQAIGLIAVRGPDSTRAAFGEVVRRTERGSSLADSLPALAEGLGPGAAIVADTLAMSERYGTPIGQALEQLADDVRERRRRQAEADARKLPIKLSFPLVACTLPSFVLIAVVPAVLGAMSSLGDTGF